MTDNSHPPTTSSKRAAASGGGTVRSVAQVEHDLRSYARALVDKADRDGILRSFDPRAVEGSSQPPNIERLFEGHHVIGTWRRTPYKPASFPVALIGSAINLRVTLGTFDSAGAVWRVALQTSELIDGAHVANLSCHELGEKALFLDDHLNLVADFERAASFLIEPYEPFRNDPLDIAVTIRSLRDGRFLVSNETTKQVALMTRSDADWKDASGNFQWNIAWECTPEMSPVADEDLLFLEKYLHPPTHMFDEEEVGEEEEEAAH